MPDYSKPAVLFHETEMFKKWLAKKGLVWVNNPTMQENLIAAFYKELMENKGEEDK
jgi:hypothetical protein